jgi:hypothetical protein
MRPRERQHLVVHVDPDHPALRADDLRGDEADLAATAAQIEDRLARPHVARGVAAAVVALDHLARNGLEVVRVVVDGAAQRRLAIPGRRAVALAHCALDVDVLR